jgi:hypothetical protein
LKPIINFNQNQDGSENTENHGNLDKGALMVESDNNN